LRWTRSTTQTRCRGPFGGTAASSGERAASPRRASPRLAALLTPRARSLFADAHLSNAETEGGDQKRAGDAAALLSVLHHLARSLFEQRLSWLPQLGERELRAAGDVVALLEGARQWAAAAGAVKTPEDFVKFLGSLRAQLQALAPGRALLLPGGWRGMESGHAIMFTLLRSSEEAFSLLIHNTGPGLEYHPSSAVAAPPKNKYQVSARSDDWRWRWRWRRRRACARARPCIFFACP
jgi:hypothetical protein